MNNFSSSSDSLTKSIVYSTCSDKFFDHLIDRTIALSANPTSTSLGLGRNIIDPVTPIESSTSSLSSAALFTKTTTTTEATASSSSLFSSSSGNIFTPTISSLSFADNKLNEFSWSLETLPTSSQLIWTTQFEQFKKLPSIDSSLCESSYNSFFSLSEPSRNNQLAFTKESESIDLITSNRKLANSITNLPQETYEFNGSENSNGVLNTLWSPYITNNNEGETSFSVTFYNQNSSKNSLDNSLSSNSSEEPKKRMQANARERDRTISVNSAFKSLRSSIPTDPPSRKLSKIEILRLAISYITHLQNILINGDSNDYPCLQADQLTNYSSIPLENSSNTNENKKPTIFPSSEETSSNDFEQIYTSNKRKSPAICTFCITKYKKMKN